MPNLRLPLTDRICARAKPEAREYALRDARQPGLTLRVQSCGARSWTFRLRERDRVVRHHLGSFPQTSVKEARQIASALLSRGAEAPKAPSTAPFFEVFQAEHEGRCGAFYKPQGLATYGSRWPAAILAKCSSFRSMAFAKSSQAFTKSQSISWPSSPGSTSSFEQTQS
jgi:hypothetical protein